MAKMSDLSDELLVKILSFLPTKVAVSTSILSKQWEFLWMWLPNLDFDCTSGSVRDFINKNLPIHKAPIINSLCLNIRLYGYESDQYESLKVENFKSWVEVAVSRSLRELSIRYFVEFYEEYNVTLVLPSSLYTCNSLVTLKLEGEKILVDVPEMICLPSLKTLQLECVKYSNEDSLRLLLSYCPVLEDLTIERQNEDNVRKLVIIIPSLQRLSLTKQDIESSQRYVIVTPSLKYFQVEDEDEDETSRISYSIEHMPELKEAHINLMYDTHIERFLKPISNVKRLSLSILFNKGSEIVYGDCIVLSQLEILKLRIWGQNWSKILIQLLKDSPNLHILDLEVVNYDHQIEGNYKPIRYRNKRSCVPKCLLKSLKTFKFKGSSGRLEERDVLSYIIKHARRLESTSILR